MLELRASEGAFVLLDEYLRDAGFFGGGAEAVVADVYLGYGLSQAVRRRTEPPPPEPCRLPLLACRIRGVDDAPRPPGGFAIGDWDRSWSDGEYVEAIQRVRAAIGRGDVYQVNLVQHLSA